MRPVLDPEKSKVHGHVFLGLSLCQNTPEGHPNSITHQNVFDLNEVIDRNYDYLCATNDDGWLVGGGEPGPPKSYKLARTDSAHVEIMAIGTYRPEWGGLTEEEVVRVMKSGIIKIPQVEVVPTAVVENPDTPPELEIRFDMEPWAPSLSEEDPLPINWQLRFLHNQLFKHFQYPSRFCPGPFHSTIVRKAAFRSPEAREKYFDKCDKAIQKWRAIGPQPLNNGPWDVDGTPLKTSNEYNSGIWLFLDRATVTHHFEPNFLPPYDTPEKKKFILDIISEEWDEKTLSFKKAEPKPTKKTTAESPSVAVQA